MIILLLSVFAFLYVFSSTKAFNSGDAGELITSGITLGLAHPSGYPLYIEVLKLFSFLPLGNVAFRMVLVSVVFSLLSLYVLYRIVFELTKDRYISLFPVALLGVAYSFWGQSVVVKFYTINLFIVALMLLFALKVVIEGYDKRYQFMISFLLGLTLSNHHMGFMMVVPLFVLSVFYTRQVLRNTPLSFLFFLLGGLLNLHLWLRGNRVFAMLAVYDWDTFLSVFLRKAYGEGASLNVARGAFLEPPGFYYALKNMSIILWNNFPPYVFPLFLLGLWQAFKLSKRVGLSISVFFLTYSLILAKLTFSLPSINAEGWYIGAHQYFLPALFGFSLFCGLGFYSLAKYLQRTELLRVAVPLSASFAVFLNFFDRLIDQNFNDNYIAYSVPKTILSSLPVGSVYNTYGDNYVFGSWYFKYVALYRQDICSSDYLSPSSSVFAPRGCYPTDMYKKSYIFSPFFKGDPSAFASSGRQYSVIYLKDPNPLSKALKNHFWVFSFALLPYNADIAKEKWSKILTKWQELEKLTMLDCSNYITDDRFSALLCNYSLPFFAYLIGSIDVKSPNSTLTYDIRYRKDNTYVISVGTNPSKGLDLPDESFTVKVGAETQHLLDLYGAVTKNNSLERFKYYKYTSNYRGKKK
ncbi:MAG: DUF2723 domain-containing protein [Aquificaceae bacterium]